jgi:putative glycosyltransferase (TIGR04372 family)
MVMRLLDLVRDHVETTRSRLPEGQVLVYPMAVSRIGHILREMFLLDRLFPDRAKVVVTFRNVRAVNELAFDELTRNMAVIYLDDFAGDYEEAQSLNQGLSTWWHTTSTGQLSGGIIDYKGVEYVVPNGSNFLTTEYCRRMVQEPGYAPERLQLRSGVIERGVAFDDRLRLDGRRVVLLHARDGTYLRNDAKNDFRSCRIENYVPLIRHLVSKGYFVIRLGHPRMTPLSVLNLSAGERESVFDAAHFTGPFPEIYYAARCEFIIHSNSGPTEYPLLFGQPSLAVNAPFTYEFVPRPREMITYRLYARGASAATLEDVMAQEVPLEAAQTEITAVENDPELLRESGEEFLAFVKGTADLPAQGWADLYEAPSAADATPRPLEGAYARVKILDDIMSRDKAARLQREFYRFNGFVAHRAVISNAFLNRARWV